MLPRLTQRANSFFMPNLLEHRPSELNWKFDFAPQNPWVAILPALAVVHEGQLTVVAGFDKKNADKLSVLEIEGPLAKVLGDLYPSETLLPLENLRLEQILGRLPQPLKYLLDLPLELQIFLDEKQVSIKTLKPLEYLKDWTQEITLEFLKLKPSSSQIREILDLLCDLKMSGKNWSDCAPKDLQTWIPELFKLRNPNLTRSDNGSAEIVQKANWPRGVRAKWERHGDQGGITIQVRVANPKEFENLKTSLQKVEIEDKLWTH
jgi:hypothetical protein